MSTTKKAASKKSNGNQLKAAINGTAKAAAKKPPVKKNGGEKKVPAFLTFKGAKHEQATTYTKATWEHINNNPKKRALVWFEMMIGKSVFAFIDDEKAWKGFITVVSVNHAAKLFNVAQESD